MLRLLLLSNSTDAAGRYLEWPRAHLRDFLGPSVREVLFVPFAGVSISWDAYAERVRGAVEGAGYRLAAAHQAPDAVTAVNQADAIAIGGGNTFYLLARLYDTGLLAAIRDRVRGGTPYVGWSAGSVVACPTIRTTNDMPIVEPPSLAALGLVPFQINAHYTDFHPPGFRGETRAERLAEFVTANPGVPVLGLPEGTLLRVEGSDMRVLGAPTSAEQVPLFGVPGRSDVPIGKRLPLA
ncbi:MAG: dipeptidase PepE [Gemmatimonadaceae bacterium]